MIGCWGNINVSVDEKGGYIIRINGKEWLRSSRTALYADNTWFSSDDNSLPLTNITATQGNDRNLGNWNETRLHYDLVRNGIHTEIIASIRQWSQISAITFYLDNGDRILTNTVPLDTNQVRTVFPSFHIEKTNDDDDQRGYFAFAGENVFSLYLVFLNISLV